ncbi:MAG: hypothetical protein AAGG69_00860 [Pseudomonadota bacterium]
MKKRNGKSVFGAREVRSCVRVVLVAMLMSVPFVLNQTAQADHGASGSSGAGYILYITLNRPG